DFGRQRPRRACGLGDPDILDVEPSIGEVDCNLDAAIFERLPHDLYRAGEEFRHIEPHGGKIPCRDSGSQTEDRGRLRRAFNGDIGLDTLYLGRPAELITFLVSRKGQLPVAEAVALD